MDESTWDFRNLTGRLYSQVEPAFEVFMKKIKLTRGKTAIVDDEDYESLNQWKWYYLSSGYAARAVYIKGSGRKNQKSEYILMHRVVNKTPIGLFTDHINRNKLDNRKSNLRNADKSLNGINRTVQANNKSGYRGVHWFGRTNRWQVYINRNSKRISLGYFRNLEDAVQARKNAELLYHDI